MFYFPLKFVPLATGLFLAAVQFLPEMNSHRFRISLHLPLAPHFIVLGHVLVGLISFLAIAAVDMTALALMTSSYFPAEVVSRVILTSLPWFMAGITAYLGATSVLLEPTMKLRAFYAIMGAGMTGLFLVDAMPGSYAHILPQLAILTLLYIPSVLLPTYNFRYRKV